MNKLRSEYRYVFIVDSSLYWNNQDEVFDPKKDLVLTYDFKLKEKILLLGGEAYYVDHLVDNDRMLKNNFLIYDFFNTWHFDKTDHDIFTYKNVPFGFSFRLEIWNDFVFYIRMYLNLALLNSINMDKLYVYSGDTTITTVLDDLGIECNIDTKQKKSGIAYYFPIAQWMDSKLRATGIRGLLYKLRELLTTIYGVFAPIIDALFGTIEKQTVFIQEYHPTKKLLGLLRSDKNIRVLLANFSKGSKIRENLLERLVPIRGSVNKFNKDALMLMEKFDKEKSKLLILDDGTDITQYVYKIIETRISKRIANSLRTLNSCIRYIDKNKVDLEILIANIGHTATLFDCVCKSRNIPSFLIINGLLGFEFSDESKHANVINSYSESIKNHYFKGMDNIVVLGDPRMDQYVGLEKKKINRKNPTVTIGTSGFNNASLISYVAIEFDFLFEILTALQKAIKNGKSMNLIVKVRPNGYRVQYEAFIKDFFPDLKVQIEDTIAMHDVLKKSDLYISIYSQTLFEASCLGVPTIYYKNDNELLFPPFNGNSELVTAVNSDELLKAYYDFEMADKRFDEFLDYSVMEQYVGPLDGNNLNRNKHFVYELLSKNKDTNA